MIKRIYTLLLATCALASAQPDFSDTRTIEHILQEDPAVLINSQGWAQYDLSIKGGSYTGSGISLNGLRLKNSWSAHYNTEIPMLGNLLSTPTIATGADNISGHLIGTANFNTQPRDAAMQFSSGIGTKERYAATMFASTENGGGYLDWEKARQVDYNANGYERTTGGAFLQFIANDWMYDLLIASQTKEFGAQGYYGVPADIYAEQQLDDTLIFSSATRGELDDAYIQASVLYRDLQDKYVIPSAAYQSDIDSKNVGLVIEGRTMEIQNIALKLRGDVEYDEVTDDTWKDDRTRSSFLIQPEARFENFTFKAGLNSVFQTSESADFLPIVGIDWFLTDNSRLYASYTETEQQPDYQTLYSTAPYKTGNAQLQQQHSHNTELGFKQFLSATCDWHVGTFFRSMNHANDWVDGVATDLGKLNVTGVDSSISYYPSETVTLKAYYQWIFKDNDIDNGLYETDYPEHMFNLSLNYQFLDEYALSFNQSTRWQADNEARTSDDFGAIASLGLLYSPTYAKNMHLSLLIDNLWGSNFQTTPGLDSRPTSAFAGISVAW